jgi:NAD(P)-dependent dehydrogenase (short-subunit alcohol dehydrogenase family)
VSRPGRLDGRTCLIVGGTRGIGLAAARRFLQEGGRVVVAGRPGESGHAVLANLGAVWACECDLALGEPEVARLFEFALCRLGGRLDILLHVAGMSGRGLGDGPVGECTLEAWQGMMQINALGVFLTNRQALQKMRDQPLDTAGLRGTIVNTGSVLERSPSPEHFGTVAYAASKGAVRALTLASAARYARDRIRFNLLVPGLIDTPMAARAVSNPQVRSYLATKQPLASGPGTVDDVAEAALYLCEPSSRFVTGAEVIVDGGWCISEGSTVNEPPLPTEAGPIQPAPLPERQTSREIPPSTGNFHERPS